MRRLSASEVHAQKVAELGLDPTALDLSSVEAIAGALRRAATFLCPCAATTLVRSVVRPLRGLVDDLQKVQEIVEETLEAMVSHGDFVESREVDEDPARDQALLLYAAPPSFVARQSGLVVLLGMDSDGFSVLPDDLESRIKYTTHLRRLQAREDENLRDDLLQLGLIKLSYGEWLKAPLIQSPNQHISCFDRLLDDAQPSRDVPGLLLLNPESSVGYYRGRWIEPRLESGRFVARRSQAYGAPLWCYVQLRKGTPEYLIDLPISDGRWRGCDEAWHLQMAIDAQRGEPQRFRVRAGPAHTRVVEFFSPVPMWARRRWDAVGEPVPVSGCLLAYRLTEAELEEELRFTREALWLEELL